MAMNIEKGKVFTNVISKDGIKVVVQTKTNHIKGTIYKYKDNRLSDALNQADRFITLTDVTIFDKKGEKIISEKQFMAINLNEIIWLVED
jgi:hypothetical protein